MTERTIAVKPQQLATLSTLLSEATLARSRADAYFAAICDAHDLTGVVLANLTLDPPAMTVRPAPPTLETGDG